MIKGSDIIGRLVGAGSMLASVIFFGYGGSVHEYFLPGLLFGASGLWLVVRRSGPTPAPDLATQQHLAQLSDSLAATQAELAATQERLERVTDEQDFMRQLASRPSVARAAAAPPLEVPARPLAPELSPPPAR